MPLTLALTFIVHYPLNTRSHMKAASLIEVLVAAHLSGYVDADNFPERGGIMLIAPPGQLKSTFIKQCYNAYHPSVVTMSDINVETLNKMRPKISQGYIRTLALPAFEKIYERNPQTASNIEGHIKAFVDEGFMLPSFANQNMLAQSEARCLVVGGLVDDCYRRKFDRWDENGFVRRFMWCSFQLKDPQMLIEAIHKWERIEFEDRVPLLPNHKIKMTVTPEESKYMMRILESQNCPATPYALLKKIFAVLKWKFNREDDKKRPMEIIRDFSECLGKRMARMTL